MQQIQSAQSALHSQELLLTGLLGKMDIPGKTPFPALVNRFSSEIAKYNKNINSYLRTYAEIVSMVNDQLNDEKIQAKAVLQFSYDFISMALEIIRFLEISNQLDPEKSRLLEQLVARKRELIQNTYYPNAKHELTVFYNPEIRRAMEDDLAKRIMQRYN
jgi:hypothetical protein